MEHESDGDTNRNWCTQYSQQRIRKEAGGLGNKRVSEDHPSYNIKICQNTEKSLGDLRRLAITQTLVRNHKLTSKIIIIIIIIIIIKANAAN